MTTRARRAKTWKAAWVASSLLAIMAACESEGTVGVSGLTDAEPPPGAMSCSSEDDCTDPEEPHCSPSDGRCHECVTATHCAAGSETCDPWGECEELCEEDTDCEGEEHCDPTLSICLACRSDTDCDDGQTCDEGECEDG